MKCRGWGFDILAALLVLLSGCGGGGTGAILAPGVPLMDHAGGTSAGTPTSAFIPNYAAETDPQSGRANALYYWARFPVRVWFDPANSNPSRQAAAAAGFCWWARDTGQVGAYTIAADAGSADIQVHFQYNGQTGYGGLTRYQYIGSGQLSSANITLNLSYLEDNALLLNAAAHEFGHAIGVGGHSTVNTDLMAFSSSIYTLSALSERDANTIKTDYHSLFGRGVPNGGAPIGPLYSAEIACAIHPDCRALPVSE